MGAAVAAAISIPVGMRAARQWRGREPGASVDKDQPRSSGKDS